MQVTKVTLAESKNQLKIRNHEEYNSNTKNYSKLPDLFEAKNNKPNFTGKQYPSGWYEDEAIEDAKKYMHEASTAWKEQLYKTKVAKAYSEIPTGVRVVIGLLSWGMTEVKLHDNINVRYKEHVKKVARLICDLKDEELSQKKAAQELKNARALAKVEYENEVNKIRTQLMESFSDRLDMEKKGGKAEIPNCIMLMDKHDDLSKELIPWTSKNSDCNFVKLADQNNDTLQDKLWEELNNAKDTFELPGKRRTLIHVDRFEDLINPKINAFENIEWLKDLMCRTAKDFGSTIIFNAKDTSKLNPEAIQPQRIAAKILVAIKSFK